MGSSSSVSHTTTLHLICLGAALVGLLQLPGWAIVGSVPAMGRGEARQGCGFVPGKKNKGGKDGKATLSDVLGALPTAQLSGRASVKKMVMLSWLVWPLAAVATLGTWIFFLSPNRNFDRCLRGNPVDLFVPWIDFLPG